MKARNILWVTGVLIFPLLLKSAESNFMIHSLNETVSNEAVSMEKKVGYIFAHGLGANQEQALLFSPNQTNKWLINKPLVLFDFPDAKNNPMEYHSSHVNLGQEHDIARLKESFEKAESTLQGYKFIIAAISRGSATAINFVALHQPESVAALVLESPFDTITNVIQHLLRRFYVNWVPFSKKIALKLAKSSFPRLNPKGIVPLNVIHKIKSTIPIMIIHSSRDRTIPINSSRNLYRSLLLAGHPHAYFLELASGEHGKLVYSIESDLYAHVLHAFYKKYDLPHNPHFAAQGENMLKHCQPTLDEINKKIKKNRSRSDYLDDDCDEIDDFDPLLYYASEKANHFSLEVSPLSTKMHTIF